MFSFVLVAFRLAIIILGCFVVAIVPMYNEPFGGCQGNGFLTLERGCTLWLNVFTGFVIFLTIAIAGLNRSFYRYLALTVVLTLGLLGGLSAMSSGLHLEILTKPALLVPYWQGAGLATIVGGLIGFLLCHLMKRK